MIDTIENHGSIILRIEELTITQQKRFNEAADQITSMLGFSEDFRMRVCKIIVDLKEDLFGKGFSLGGDYEGFFIVNISKRVGLSRQCLDGWLKVYCQILETPSISKSADFNELSFTEKCSVVRDIRQNKKKFTEAVKDHYSNKDNPVSKKIFYLERYIRAAIATARALEDLGKAPSQKQRTILADLKQLSLQTSKVLGKILDEYPIN